MSGYLIKYVGKLSYISLWSRWKQHLSETELQVKLLRYFVHPRCALVTQSVKLAFTPNGSVSIFDIQSVTVPGV